VRIDDPTLISDLEAHWSPPDGFLFELRSGILDPAALERLLGSLAAIELSGDGSIPRRVASLLWYMPEFIAWQKERVEEAEGDLDKLTKARWHVQAEVERILGVP
jgi:hypothetical protein